MPIRLNLLAEQQAAEEMRRRDPVKRAGMVGGVLVGIMAVWCGFGQLQVMQANNELNKAQSDWNSIEKKYQATLKSKSNLDEQEGRLNSLHNLATNRFLWSVPLDAMQNVMVDNVQVIRFSAEQNYFLTEAIKTSTNHDTGRISPGKPGTATEDIKVILDGRDWGRPSEQNYARFQEAIQNNSYFKTNLAPNGLSLLSLSPPAPDFETGRTNIGFSLQCLFLKRTR
jgi:hypothetical protein